MTIQGIHHITIVCADAQRTVDFYTSVLGQRLVKQTVNFDDPGSYHLYFGNHTATPGSIITFFEWPAAPQGHPGIGGTHHLALKVADRTGLLQWKRRLVDHGCKVDGPLDRHYFESIYTTDPDGTIIEIATLGPGWAIDEPPQLLGTEFRAPPPAMLVSNRDSARIEAETWPEPVPTITAAMALSRGLHHITAIGSDIQRTDAFLGGLLGMRRVKMTSNFDDPNSAHWYWGVGDGSPGTVITYFERDPRRADPVRMGAGQTHHFALAVPDDAAQQKWRQILMDAGLRVSPVMDRIYFKSIYTNDPDGHIVELATAGPGFTVDEELATLGQHLQLPPWLEKNRATIEGRLRPIRTTLNGEQETVW
ncbi:MAG: ring-cleaving dioxygenase [Herpetosiphon sp.]